MDAQSFIAGLIVGVLVGIPLAYILVGRLRMEPPSSVVFARDSEGRITEIHYVPGVAR